VLLALPARPAASYAGEVTRSLSNTAAWQ